MNLQRVEHGANCGNSAGVAARVFAWSGVAALLTLAAFFAFSYFTGRTSFFVARAYLWLTPAATVVILAMAAAQTVVQLRSRGRHACHCHPPRPIFHAAYAAITFLGIGFALAVNPQQYSPEGIDKRRAVLETRDREVEQAVAWVLGQTLASSVAAATPVALTNTPTVVELFEAANNNERSVLEGKFVTVVGQCVLRGEPSAERFEIYRLVVTCCVADATAVSVEVARKTSELLDAGGWVSVGGVLKFDSRQNSSMPVIHAATVSKIAGPSSPYL